MTEIKLWAARLRGRLRSMMANDGVVGKQETDNAFRTFRFVRYWSNRRIFPDVRGWTTMANHHLSGSVVIEVAQQWPRPRHRPFCEDDRSRNTGPGLLQQPAERDQRQIRACHLRRN